ncbi:MAG TPA: hypothetical protein V6D22_03865 [Candidatus Obscuribacterales bacterium]
MYIKTEAKNKDSSNSASFPAEAGGKYKTTVPPGGTLKLTVPMVDGDVTFSVTGDLEETSSEARSISVRSTSDQGKGAITIHAGEGDVKVDVTVGGNVMVGLMLNAFRL